MNAIEVVPTPEGYSLLYHTVSTGQTGSKCRLKCHFPSSFWTAPQRVFVWLPGEFGMQPEPSLVLSQLVQRHAGPSLPLARQPSPPTQRLQQAPTAPSPVLQVGTAGQGGPLLAAGSAKSPAPSAGLDPPGSSTPHQQQRAQLKGQKRRIPPTSKVQLDLPRPTVQHYLRKHAMQCFVCEMPDAVPDFHFEVEGYRISSWQLLAAGGAVS